MKKRALMIAGSSISLALSIASPAFAQTEPEEKTAEEVAVPEEEKAETAANAGGIVVTGSRIKQNTFQQRFAYSSSDDGIRKMKAAYSTLLKFSSVRNRRRANRSTRLFRASFSTTAPVRKR